LREKKLLLNTEMVYTLQLPKLILITFSPYWGSECGFWQVLAGSGGLGQVTWVIGALNMCGRGGYEVMKVDWLTEVSTCLNPQNLAGNFLMNPGS
jgi:hypothetical protein